MKTIRQLFKEYLYNKRDIPELIRRIRYIVEDEMPNNISVITDMPHASGVSDPTSKAAINLITKKAKVLLMIKDKLADLRKVNAIIRRQDDKYRRMLTKVVKEEKSLADAFLEMPDIYSEYHTFVTAHTRLIDKLEKEEADMYNRIRIPSEDT